MKSCSLEPVLVEAAVQMSELALVKQEAITSEELTPLDNFLNEKIQDYYSPGWDYASTSSSEQYTQIVRGQALEIALMRGCVTSPCDVAGGGHSILDATCRVFDSSQANESHYDTLECYSFLWDAFKGEDSLLLSAFPSNEIIATASSYDEDVISSSSNSMHYEDKPPSETIAKQKTLDSPPDDMRAFFGHPLTRATSALNGDEADTSADAEALLHEYKHISSMGTDDLKVNEKIPGILDIVDDEKSDILALPALGGEKMSAMEPADLPSPASGGIQHSSDGTYDDEEVSSQDGDDMGPMKAYVDMFLSDQALLDNYIMNSHVGEHSDNSMAEELADSTREQTLRKSSKSEQRSVIHRKDCGDEKREVRKSRTRCNVVTSSTRGPARDATTPTASETRSVSVYQQPPEAGVYSSPDHQFQPEGAVVTSADITVSLSDVVHPVLDVARGSLLSPHGHSATLHNTCPAPSAADLQEQGNQQNILAASQLHHLQQHTHICKVEPSPSDIISRNTSVIPSSTSCQVSTAASSSTTPHPLPTVASATTSARTKVSSSPTISQTAQYEPAVTESSYLKKALSQKIRSRRSTEENFAPMPSHHLHFIPHDVSEMVGLESKFSPLATIKQEEPYMESYEQQYTYGPDLANTMASCGGGLQNIIPVTMATCEGVMAPSDSNNNNSLAGMTHGSFHHISGGPADHVTFHQHRPQHNSPHQGHLNHASNSQAAQDSVFVQSSEEQYFQVLQPMESHSGIGSSGTNFYSHAYHRIPNTHILDMDKQVAVERFCQQQYPYGKSYMHFLNPDNSYSKKSPDSGFHEPCLSPISSAVNLKEIATNGVTKEKPKKKKLASGCGLLMRQYSSSDKAAPRSPAIQKLDSNTTGYSYFLETPISTTQRKDEDRVTYLNKSQYYGLTLDFNSQEHIIKCAVVKSVIILAFREEKPMEEERKAWEFWHGRQHSYKQRILDIDTKNCQGILPQNIEELSFNAVAVKWNPMESPVRVNIAVHCLSTDFSNQKGVKGIPLHIQIDTYEQTPKENNLIHRGYCQIKAFCDKGAERKTRDEERRKAAKGKSDEFGSAPPNNKGRKKTEEAFHEPCERSEFYSMANTTTPPVFFNPLHETTEFIHKSLSLGGPTSPDEEISSLPVKLDLPDSCDDYYSNSPAKRARRDSSSNLKDQQKVLLYIKERHETAFTALMLEAPTLHGLLKSIEHKYSIAPSKVKNFYKKSRKGILVKLDDNIVRHYSHEATFIIETNILNDNGDYEIILIEIDPVSS